MVRDASEPAISVVMAVLDGARFIGEQLASFAAQTVLPDELIVGDEGSVDATVEIVERFAAGAPFRVVLVRNPVRLGVTDNFLSLAARARGPIIAFSDCDDVWDSQKLERIAPWFRDPAVGLVMHRALVVDETLRPLGRRYPVIGRTVVRQARRVDPWLPGSGMCVFRKALIDVAATDAGARPREAGGHSMDHDDWVYFLAGSLGKTVFLAEDLALYRQHGGSYMGAPAGDLRERVDRGLRLDAGDFRRQGAMFRARRDFWVRIASNPGTRQPVRDEAARSAAWCDRLASLQDARAGVRDQASGRARRLLRLLRLIVRAGYRPRTWAGLGLRALAADTISLVRPGPGTDALAAAAELANRVANERAAGRSPEAIATQLTTEGVPPVYGNRWTAQMIRDLNFQGRRASEATAIEAAQVSIESPDQPAPQRSPNR